MATTYAQIESGLWGLLVGDAVGVPYEFHAPAEIPAHHAIQMIPPEDFPRSYYHVAAGTWSDDGSQALCLAASLVAKPDFDLTDFARRLVNWVSAGYMAVDGIVFDVGIQTGAALHRLASGESPDRSGCDGERNNGNGSLMRSLPLALLHRGDHASLVAAAHRQSAVTHAHPRSQACCALYCLWARHELTQHPSPWDAAVQSLRSIYPASSPHRRELEEVVLTYNAPTGSGYVVDSLQSARLACHATSYEKVIQSAVALGNDTDTTACIAGGIAGIRHGKTGIPAHWLASLRGKNILVPLLEQIRRSLPQA
jgi:ADP-ribosyl-[dinitrogen reductase] hydrolase